MYLILFRNHPHVIPMTTTTTTMNIEIDQYDQQSHHHDQYDQQADTKFVKKFTQPNFRQKNFTHEKHANHSQKNSISVSESVKWSFFLVKCVKCSPGLLKKKTCTRCV